MRVFHAAAPGVNERSPEVTGAMPGFQLLKSAGVTLPCTSVVNRGSCIRCPTSDQFHYHSGSDCCSDSDRSTRRCRFRSGWLCHRHCHWHSGCYRSCNSSHSGYRVIPLLRFLSDSYLDFRSGLCFDSDLC